jgi:C-terminal processing protease CtpA/Prc
VRYKVLSGDEWRQLDYRNRIEQAREHVTKLSGGRVGYLHLAAMGGENRVEFERQAYAQVAGKDALVIDVRFNAGGNIADSLIDWLERRPHGYVRARDSEEEISPSQAWTKPIVVLINEHSYSNAELFASAIRTRRLGRLVGQPTPGYVIWTDGLRLVDGTNARMPQSGAWRLDGTPFENNGEVPDVRVLLTPEDRLAGRDPQLDKALGLLGFPKK